MKEPSCQRPALQMLTPMVVSLQMVTSVFALPQSFQFPSLHARLMFQLRILIIFIVLNKLHLHFLLHLLLLLLLLPQLGKWRLLALSAFLNTVMLLTNAS